MASLHMDQARRVKEGPHPILTLALAFLLVQLVAMGGGHILLGTQARLILEVACSLALKTHMNGSCRSRMVGMSETAYPLSDWGGIRVGQKVCPTHLTSRT